MNSLGDELNQWRPLLLKLTHLPHSELSVFHLQPATIAVDRRNDRIEWSSFQRWQIARTISQTIAIVHRKFPRAPSRLSSLLVPVLSIVVADDIAGDLICDEGELMPLH